MIPTCVRTRSTATGNRDNQVAMVTTGGGGGQGHFFHFDSRTLVLHDSSWTTQCKMTVCYPQTLVRQISRTLVREFDMYFKIKCMNKYTLDRAGLSPFRTKVRLPSNSTPDFQIWTKWQFTKSGLPIVTMLPG